MSEYTYITTHAKLKAFFKSFMDGQIVNPNSEGQMAIMNKLEASGCPIANISGGGYLSLIHI